MYSTKVQLYNIPKYTILKRKWGKLVTSRGFHIQDTIQNTHKNKWNYVVNEAERAIGYPTSFLSLKWILNDEIANGASHTKELLETINSSQLNTAKNILQQNQLPTWGLTVLLLSKVAGLNSKSSEHKCNKTADILHSQTIVAKVIEMLKTIHIIHKGVINVKPSEENAAALLSGNKLSLLFEDYLISLIIQETARLKNFQVQEIIFSALRDLSESVFVGLNNKNNEPLPSKPLSVQTEIPISLELGVKPFQIENVLGNMKAEWTLRNILGGGSLLGKCCQSTLILANHESHVQELGYSFGRNLALSWQACLEKNQFIKEKFSLVSAPVMFHLEYDPSFYTEVVREEVDYNLIRKIVMKGPGLEKTINLQNEFLQIALDALKEFPDSESKRVLVNLVKSLR